jgi:hypothetical protein
MESGGKKVIRWKPMSEYEIEQKAKTVYENIKTQLEAKHHGETVIIEVESGDYFLGKNMRTGFLRKPVGCLEKWENQAPRRHFLWVSYRLQSLCIISWGEEIDTMIEGIVDENVRFAHRRLRLTGSAIVELNA